MTTGPHAAKRGSIQWLAAAVGFVAGLIAVTALVALGAGGDASPLQRILLAVIVVASVMFFVLRRSPLWFRALWVGAFSVLFLGVGSLAIRMQQRMAAERELNLVAQQMPAELQKATEALSSGKPLPKRDPLVRPAEDRDYAMAIYLTKWAVHSRIDSNKRYLDDLTAIGWERAIEPEELRRPDARDVLRSRIAMAHGALDARIARERKITREYMDGMKDADLPRDFRRGFERSTRSVDMDRSVNEFAATERAIIKATEAFAEAMLSHEWSHEDGQYLFHSDAGLAAFEKTQAALLRAIEAGDAGIRDRERKMQELRNRIESVPL